MALTFKNYTFAEVINAKISRNRLQNQNSFVLTRLHNLCIALQKRAMRIVLWCNGSTTGFGSVCLGSNPGRTTQKKSALNAGFFCIYPTPHIGPFLHDHPLLWHTPDSLPPKPATANQDKELFFNSRDSFLSKNILHLPKRHAYGREDF